MFHLRTGQIAATLMLLSVSSLPMTSYAGEQAAPAAVTQPAPSTVAQSGKAPGAEAFSFDTLRDQTKAKLSETQDWVKDKTHLQDYENPIKSLEVKIDNFQDQVQPIGRSIKTNVKKHARGTGILKKGDSMFTVFGLLLMASFGLVLILMSLSGPASRLGGRH